MAADDVFSQVLKIKPLRLRGLWFVGLIFAHAIIGVVSAQTVTSEAEVAQRSGSYLDAFNRRDVDACAEHWSKDAEYEIGGKREPIVGRAAIAAALRKMLSTDEPFQLTVGDQRFRKLSADVVTEDGIARLQSESHGVERARYLVIHVKENGTWYRESVREIPMAPSSALAVESELNSLVGKWQSESDEGTLTLNAEWVLDRRFLSRTFQLSGQDGTTITGTEWIGWDPAARVIRSWSFDSRGGFESGVWHRDGRQWIVKVRAVLPDGNTATEQRAVSINEDGQLETRVIEQAVGGRLLPGTKPIALDRLSTS